MKNELFVYGAYKKRFNGIVLISIFLFIGICITAYLSFFYGFNPFKGTFLAAIFSHVKNHIATMSLLGTFYVFFFGGLFFVTLPLEVIFFVPLVKHNDALVLLIVFTGAFLSYTIDYLLGYRFSNISRKLISIKQFYKLKAVINRKGALAILFFNIIGVGSQPVTFILGVFKYNAKRLALMTITGQLIKYIGLYLFFLLF